MAGIWQGPRVELLLNERSNDSAENAERAAVWAHALAVQNVIVVSSWWHVRLGLYYRGQAFRGVSVCRVRTRRCRRIARHLGHELRYLPRVRRTRSALDLAVADEIRVQTRSSR
jgi:hypothetical protein